MSTYVFLTCLDHEPPLDAMDESEQHAWKDGVMDQIREWVDQREMLVSMWDHGRLNHHDHFLTNTMRFLAQHRACRIAAHTENDEWVDLGYGVPNGARRQDDDREVYRL